MASPAPGNRIGPYDLLAPIGAGGMGEVWKARDTRLDRFVAIKFSSARFSDRFEREARAVAALNHPNICTLYDVGPNYLVMEFVDGGPLKGPLPLATAIRYAGQILDALGAAHRKGIIHRDLKPANILVTKSGIKLLDFGLAKHGPPLDQTKATLTGALTGEGQIVGTLQYMPPEQLQGREADARSDIFSFGCVLYEMLTGNAPFAGSSAASIIAAIIEREPAPIDVPGPLERVVKTCLAKDPDQRFQDALDAERALEWAAQEQAPTPAPRNRLRAAVWSGAIVAALAAGAIAAWFAKPAPVPAAVRKFDIAVRRLTVDNLDHPVISPDGQSIAYKASGQLWVRRLDQFEGRTIPGSGGGRLATWSPDSKSLAFVLNEQLMKVTVAGGDPVRIASVPGFGGGAGLAWAEPERILFASASKKGIEEISASGGEWKIVVPIEKEEKDLHYATVIPGTGIILFVADRGKRGDTIWAFSRGKRSKVAQFSSTFLPGLTWSPSGHIVFGGRGNSVWAIPFSPSQVRATGEPFLVADNASYPSASLTGSLVFTRGWTATGTGSRMVWADRSGRIVSQIGDAQSGMASPALSVDATKIAYIVAAIPFYARDVWVHDLRLNTRTQLTQTSDAGYSVSWAPREPRIFYSYAREGDYSEFLQGIGTQIASLVINKNEGKRDFGRGTDPAVSPDGRFLVYTLNHRLMYKALDGSGSEKYATDGTRDVFPRLSPDGRLLAFGSIEPYPEIIVTTFPGSALRWQIAFDGIPLWPCWSRSGSNLYFVTVKNELFEVPVTTKPELSIGKPSLVFNGTDAGIDLMAGYDVGPADGRFLVLAGDPENPSAIRVIDNWAGEFTRTERR
jgi:Tol biopolymer transport system component